MTMSLWLPAALYLALHGHRWIKAKVKRIAHSLDINTLEEHDATEIAPNAIGHIELALQEAITAVPYAQSRVLGSLMPGGHRLAQDLRRPAAELTQRKGDAPVTRGVCKTQ